MKREYVPLWYIKNGTILCGCIFILKIIHDFIFMLVVLQTLSWSYSSINQSVQNELVAGKLHHKYFNKLNWKNIFHSSILVLTIWFLSSYQVCLVLCFSLYLTSCQIFREDIGLDFIASHRLLYNKSQIETYQENTSGNGLDL